MNFLKVYSLICLVITVLNGRSQVAINTTGAVGDNSALLDIQSTSNGILIPRMTTAQRDAISLPETGLMVYVTDGNPGFYYFTGTTWSGSFNHSKSKLIFSIPLSRTSIGIAANTSSYTLTIPSYLNGYYTESISFGGRFNTSGITIDCHSYLSSNGNTIGSRTLLCSNSLTTTSANQYLYHETSSFSIITVSSGDILEFLPVSSATTGCSFVTATVVFSKIGH